MSEADNFSNIEFMFGPPTIPQTQLLFHIALDLLYPLTLGRILGGGGRGVQLNTLFSSSTYTKTTWNAMATLMLQNKLQEQFPQVTQVFVTAGLNYFITLEPACLLERLDLSWCQAITDAGVQDVVKGCRGLKHLGKNNTPDSNWWH